MFIAVPRNSISWPLSVTKTSGLRALLVYSGGDGSRGGAKEACAYWYDAWCELAAYESEAAQLEGVHDGTSADSATGGMLDG